MEFDAKKFYFMSLAMDQAREAYKKYEVPVGAVIVKNNCVVSVAHNLRESSKNAVYHAEILAISRACKKLKNWRLVECEIYVTLEPCIMCAGAILQTRMKGLFFGAYDANLGACGSVLNLFSDGRFGSFVECRGGIMIQESEDILSSFFRDLRMKKDLQGDD